MLSCGMLTSLADSMAAFSRMLPFGSPPPPLAATVISRRILEKSLPRWTSALPFFRLICDHRECPDISSPMGAPKWPPYPQRSSRPGGAVALLVNLLGLGGPEMAPNPPSLGPPRQSRGAPRQP